MRRRNFLGAVGALFGAPALILAKGESKPTPTKSTPTKPKEPDFQMQFDVWWPMTKTTASPCAFVNAESIKIEWTNRGLRISGTFNTEAKSRWGKPLVSKGETVEVRGIKVIAPFGTFEKTFEPIKLQSGDTLNMNYDLHFDREIDKKLKEMEEAEKIRKLEELKLQIIAQNPSGLMMKI